MQSFASNLATVAAVATSLLALFALVSAAIRAIRFFANLPQEIKAYFFRPRYILIPTPDEMARYSAKEFRAERQPSQEEMYEDALGAWGMILSEWRAMAKSRIRLLAMNSALVYFFFCCVLIYKGTPRKDGADEWFVAGGNVLVFFTVSYSLAVFAYIAKRWFKKLIWSMWHWQ